MSRRLGGAWWPPVRWLRSVRSNGARYDRGGGSARRPERLIAAHTRYDGLEPTDWTATRLAVEPGWEVTFAEIDRCPWRLLPLDPGERARIHAALGLVETFGPFGAVCSASGLPVYFAVRGNSIAVIGLGEYQPARWIAELEGIHRIGQGPDAP